jgi:uncharacterized iron-regulated protein
MMLFMVVSMVTAVPGGVIHHGADVVSVEEMIEVLDGAEVVFVGEKHDDTFAHQWELFVWESLASDERALALEMFETDVQSLLDSYLAGEITVEKFLAESRPWGNYPTDYSPMVEYAKENGYRVIAANVPRSFAALVARGGLGAILQEPGFEGLYVDSSNTGYRDRFLATMDAIGDQMHGMPVDPENMYRAQLLKDAVMAQSVQNMKVLFICGSFHSDYRSGIPDQIVSEDFLTVTVLGGEEEYHRDLADFVIVREGL